MKLHWYAWFGGSEVNLRVKEIQNPGNLEVESLRLSCFISEITPDFKRCGILPGSFPLMKVETCIIFLMKIFHPSPPPPPLRRQINHFRLWWQFSKIVKRGITFLLWLDGILDNIKDENKIFSGFMCCSLSDLFRFF